jgi:hypothetical protein
MTPDVQKLREFIQHKPDCPRSLPRLSLDLGPGWTQSTSYAKPCNCGLAALLAVLGDPPVAEQEKEATNQPDPTCEHGVAWDVHCCGCHSGFLFDSRKCVCF